VTTNANASIHFNRTILLNGNPVNLTAVDPGGTWTGTGITNALLGTSILPFRVLEPFQIIYLSPVHGGDADTVGMISV